VEAEPDDVRDVATESTVIVELLRFATAGSVDDGKSTLIGRLLFEAGLDGIYDATIAIVAPEAVRAERAGARGHQALEERGARQLTQAEKAERATHAIVNDGDFVDLERRLSAVLATLSG